MQKITEPHRQRSKDTGLVIALACLILGLQFKDFLFFKICVGLIILSMTIPTVFYPFSIVWFGLAEFMGKWMSKVIVTVLFFVMVTPVGLIRKLCGHDPLNARAFKKDTGPGLNDRHHTYRPEDFTTPF